MSMLAIVYNVWAFWRVHSLVQSTLALALLFQAVDY